MITHVLRVVAYVMEFFSVQVTSHFVVNAEHYAAVGHLRAEPIFALGRANRFMTTTCGPSSAAHRLPADPRSPPVKLLAPGWSHRA